MMTPIVTLTFPLDEAKELYRALLERSSIENTLRQERGLEPVSLPLLAERIESVLRLTQEEAYKEAMHVEEELWEHAWLSFTDEWAWHRAKQDVLQTIGKKHTPHFTHEQLDAMTENLYETEFETYQREINLPGHEHGGSCEWPKGTKKKTTRIVNKKTSKK